MRADGYDTLPISAGIVGTKVGGMFGGVPGAFIGGVSAGGIVTVYVKYQKIKWELDEKMLMMPIMRHRKRGISICYTPLCMMQYYLFFAYT